MKAISYLQKLGAIPQYNLWDLKMSVVVIVDELFCEEMVMEPDCFEWVQSAETPESSSERSDLILYATSGNVKDLAPVLLKVEDLETIQNLIEQLLDLRIFYYSLDDEVQGLSLGDSGDAFAALYNSFAGLKKHEGFESKSQILHFYFCGALREIGEGILRKNKIEINTGKSM